MDSCLRKRYIDNTTWYENDECGLTEEYTRLNIFLFKSGYTILDKHSDGRYYYQIFGTKWKDM